MTVRIHPTALIEDGVTIGEGTAVWDHVHLRSGSRIGAECIVGEKTYVAGGVRVGDRVKINAFCYLCSGVTIEDGVMVSAHVVFTNDLFPRATDPDLVALQPSEPTAETLSTWVRRGATIGASAVIGPGLVLGEWCMVGMGSVVTRDVRPHGVVAGNPAQLVGLVCRCGKRVLRFKAGETLPVSGSVACSHCARVVSWD
jgi:acetyltransferase-like isoleucine patch superfamily enzyme